MRVSTVLVCACVLGLVGLSGCAADRVSQAPAPPPAARAIPTVGAGPVTAERGVSFKENDFAENDSNRDPFRAFTSIVNTPPPPNQLSPVLPQYAIDELKLVAIVLGGEYPRAMVTEPNGKGWVVKKGDYIGRPDVVHQGGSNGTDYQVNWRVDRVREGELVLAREDKITGTPTVTKVIALHTLIDKDSDRQARL